MQTTPRWRRVLSVIVSGWLFFFALELMGRGMKLSFAGPLQAFLADNAGAFTELRSFVIGVLGTAVVQSSSTVTSMCVVLTQEGVMPLVIAAGIVHGANLGTSVTSSIVAFATDAPRWTGRPLRDLKALLFAPRGPGFERAVGTAVVHDFFNIIMVTAILVFLELPFGWILRLSEWAAGGVAGRLAGADGALAVLGWLSPKTYTAPVAEALQGLGLPGGLMALGGLALLFGALKLFSGQMRALVLQGTDEDDATAMGDRLLGRHPADTFVRGLALTMLVQSSSATTSMVVPLAAMGFFGVKRIFPFILGANVGTTTTALLAAAGGLGTPGLHEGLSIALCHLFLNAAAVGIAVVVPGLPTSILGSAKLLGRAAARRPAWLLVYLGMLTVVLPVGVYLLPQDVAAVGMVVGMLSLLLGPHVWVRRELAARLGAGGGAGVSAAEAL
jgi:sodium-dependent phosphate cotransporter